MLRSKRYASSWATANSKFKLLSEYKLKCGLEIHTQLNTPHKLFSMAENQPFQSMTEPNSRTSYFDVSLPGTQPNLNPEVVLYALKLAKSLDCEINLQSTFDRKHYFYGDQPLGYQITQHYNPFAINGVIRLNKQFDGILENEHPIKIIQLQIEQDTGKTVYDEKDQISLIDLNRSNVPLVEMVTAPDFHDLKQIRAFIKKYQSLVRHLKVSTGDLETGAMRIDVNISVNDFPRIELKNLPNTSSVMNSIKYEYMRQVEIIRNKEAASKLQQSETRGWTGVETVKLRSKETTIDYRYMPDSELPPLSLDPSVIEDVSSLIPELPEEIMKKLMAAPYNLSLKDAKILTVSSSGHDALYSNEGLLEYYLQTFHKFLSLFEECAKADLKPRINYKLPSNWIIHVLLGNLNKLQMHLDDCKLTPEYFAIFLQLINDNKISKTSGDLLLFHIMENNISSPDFSALISEFELNKVEEVDETELNEICSSIISDINDPKLLDQIKSGQKKNSLKFLIGQGMRSTQGKIDAKLFEETFKRLLNITW
ncbi:hypothetical protein ACO0QE_004235 [Hanseniaspora vineae]